MVRRILLFFCPMSGRTFVTTCDSSALRFVVIVFPSTSSLSNNPLSSSDTEESISVLEHFD